MITKHREEYEKALAKPLTACKEQKLIDFVDAFMNVASKIYEATTYDNKKQAEEGIYSLPNYVLIDLHLLIQKAHDIQLSATPANKRLIRPLDDRDEKIAGLHVELGNQEVELTRMRNELGILKIIQNNMFNELDSTKKELITITAERNAAILEVLRFKEKLRILKIWVRAY